MSGLFDVANGALINWGGFMALALGDIIALDFMERVFAARNPKTARKGAFMGGALTIFTVLPTSMLGIVALYYLPVDTLPDLALPLLSVEYMPFAIGAAILMGVVGASMSTASGGLLAISSVISRNLINRIIRRRWLGRPRVYGQEITDPYASDAHSDGRRRDDLGILPSRPGNIPYTGI